MAVIATAGTTTSAVRGTVAVGLRVVAATRRSPLARAVICRRVAISRSSLASTTFFWAPLPL